MGIRSHVQGANIPSMQILSIQEVYAWPELIYNMCVYDIKDNIPCVQVKNKPYVGEWKHAFILSSMVYMVVNTKSSRL